MSEMNDFEGLESELAGKEVKVKRVRANIWIHEDLKARIQESYGEGQLGRVLEQGALMKLRRDGYIPEKPSGAEPANMKSYVEGKKSKIALEEIKERVVKANSAPETKRKKP